MNDIYDYQVISPFLKKKKKKTLGNDGNSIQGAIRRLQVDKVLPLTSWLRLTLSFDHKAESLEPRALVEKVVGYLFIQDNVVEDFGCIFICNILVLYWNLREE